MAEKAYSRRRKKRVHVGPVIPYLEGFGALLLEQQYSPSTVQFKLGFLVDFSQWIEERQLAVGDLNDDLAVECYWQLRRESRSVQGNLKTLLNFIEHLRIAGIAPRPVPKVDDSEIACLLREFQGYLVKERGIASEKSFARYLKTARLFLVECFCTGSVRLEDIRARDVTDFLLQHTSAVSHRTAQLRASILRSFLRFLHVRGYVRTDLVCAVPRVGGWKLAALPKFVPPEDVKRILASCDQSTAAGRRDYAILLLFARLGLRGAEVVAMRLEDVD